MLFNNIQKALYEIRGLIVNNSDIQKLLYYTTPNCLESSTITSSAILDKVVLYPVFNTTKEPFNSSSFITIQVVKLQQEDEEALDVGLLRINIMTQNALWEINNSKIRPIEIASIIRQLLDNTKFSISHKLNYVSIELAVLDENISGYIILFNITEGSGLENAF